MRPAMVIGDDAALAAASGVSPNTQLRRQVVDLYRRGTLPALLSALCAAGLVAVLGDALAAPAVTAWLLTHALLAGTRALLVRHFKRQRVGDAALRRWRGYYVAIAAAVGIAWGTGSVLLLARAAPVQQLLAWVVLGAALLAEFPALARLGRPFIGVLALTLAAPLALMLIGPHPQPAAAGALLLLGSGSALAGLELHRTYLDGLHLQLEFARLARFDPLTGLANRRHFDETLAGEWQRALRLRGEVALIIFDVDEFKIYNDHFGHPGGDACLRRLAAVTRQLVHRHGDLVARLGGEEFAVLLPLTPLAGARAVADTLRQAIENLRLPHAPAAQRPVVTVSVGVACLRPGSGLTPDDLIRAADAALYEAKHAGRNCVVMAPPAETPALVRRVREMPA
ncbi:diguanylate cyclase [Immundisolibacter sp.]|uniref:GGDEF domain-containing protein n=1 Tax=Immundisolibacter sp. TaxID=1934948 RepID=UPI00261B32D2|nr:GGDEF domain-containing protein [Immundisolibacter sp.]